MRVAQLHQPPQKFTPQDKAGELLALATWISRTGRAVAWTISALVASVIGWPIVGFLVFSGGGRGGGELDELLVFVMGSPFYNSAMPTVGLENRGGSGMPISMQNAIWVGSIAWLLFYASIAATLYVATLRTFDRCLGRMPEHPIGRAIKPKPSKAWVRELD